MLIGRLGGGSWTNGTGGSSGTNCTGGAARRTTRKQWKTMTKHIRTHQECPELVQEAPQMPHDLAEPLFKPFCQHSSAPTPRARQPWSTTLTSEPQPQTHARRSHRDFPVRSRLPTSDHLWSAQGCISMLMVGKGRCGSEGCMLKL